MTQTIIKSLEYEEFFEDRIYMIRALIVSAPEELEISNVDKEEHNDFLFKISVCTEPKLNTNIADINSDLIYLIGKNGDNRLGHIIDNAFAELEETRFLQRLESNVLSVLMFAGDTGHFKM